MWLEHGKWRKTNEIITTVFDKYKNSEEEFSEENYLSLKRSFLKKWQKYFTKVLIQSQNDKGHTIH